MTSSIFAPALPKKAGDHQHWANLQGSAASLAISQAAKTFANRVLLVTSDTPSALKLEKEIRFFSDAKVQVFPDWETLPYDNFSPHQDIISQRLETLYQLTQPKSGIFIVPVNTLLQRMAPVNYLGQFLLMLEKGQTLNIDEFRLRLEKAGYTHVNQVMAHSEFSIRGSIIDLYPMGSKLPFRIDLFDDEIDSIRTFDPDNQRSQETVERIRMLPAHEFPTDEDAIERFRKNYKAQFDGGIGKGSIFHDVTSRVLPAGIEYYLPLFFDNTATLFDYLPKDTLILSHGDLQSSAEFFWADLNERYEQHRWDPLKPLLPPTELFLRIEQLFAELKNWRRVSLFSEVGEVDKPQICNYAIDKIGDIAVNPQLKVPTSKIQESVKNWLKNGYKVLFCSESQGRQETLQTLLKKADIKPKTVSGFDAFLSSHDNIGICVGLVEHSFIINESDAPLAFITETELLGHKVSQRRLRDKREATDESAVIRNLAELTPGQAVVHLEHGIGRFKGLQTLDVGGITTEYLTIEYAKEAKLYVPVSALHLISRYTGGDTDGAPLHSLGSDSWSKAKQKAAEKIRDVAAQLLDVYAQRAAKPGFAYPVEWDGYQSFADSFPFEETADQQQAIAAVLNDMQSPNAMDRLVCGDVGFGKTEVAMRAAYIAASQSKQVAILVPTTLLAQQHYENFVDRFANTPVRVEVMSRFKSTKEQNQVLESLAAGNVDIVVGTHKLIQKDVKFHNLGLVIIDEEHRFGVQQKEKFKALRAEVDILTLTATPIPRTLNMALSGMRDLSIIATPPAKRLAIKTFVRQKDKPLVREAIMREILRGGQVYFLHNEVESIEKTAQDIIEIVPEAKVAVAHGQMRERDLERVMSDFYHQRFNVLVCTTIIETGIDVPSANTIIMDRADHLGLAQLHQLRGRVGRSHHQAYAYLLTPHPKRMTKDAKKRLDAISSLEDLGAGFALATHDLEIRGAGELLGEDQSGQMQTIGFSLYMEMLEQAVECLKEGKEPTLDSVLSKQTEIELRIPALLPEDYIPDVNTRLSQYKKIASCKNTDQLEDAQVELIDRFGLLPDATRNLIAISEMKLVANRLGITKIEASGAGGVIEFSEQTKVDPGFLIRLLQSQPNIYKLDGPQKLKFKIPTENANERVKLINSMLEEFEKQQVA
ncbi:transcription-repair coupling factor [Alteromonas sp. a30]|uniref:transcription-repair coupling factor n=1 Tax=Alteromonas sp. a30 TaxID=2730917 RepID=UPI00227E7D14|nr:transcription-repair coupling factor [Alteromonas sp. a30]MCY7294221.1 transcription-repair coupling factor [Alteromonas sp. a30]